MSLRVRRLRSDRGLTQFELSRFAGQSEGWVGDLERGEATCPTVGRILGLSDALDINSSDLVRTVDPMDFTRIAQSIQMLARRLARQSSRIDLSGDEARERRRRSMAELLGSQALAELKRKAGGAEGIHWADVERMRKQAALPRLKAVGQRIKELRVQRKWSQAKLSGRVGMTPQHLGVIEGGRGQVSLDALQGIAAELGVYPSDLVLVLDDESSARRTTHSLRCLLDDLELL